MNTSKNQETTVEFRTCSFYLQYSFLNNYSSTFASLIALSIWSVHQLVLHNVCPVQYWIDTVVGNRQGGAC